MNTRIVVTSLRTSYGFNNRELWLSYGIYQSYLGIYSVESFMISVFFLKTILYNVRNKNMPSLFKLLSDDISRKKTVKRNLELRLIKYTSRELENDIRELTLYIDELEVHLKMVQPSGAKGLAETIL